MTPDLMTAMNLPLPASAQAFILPSRKDTRPPQINGAVEFEGLTFDLDRMVVEPPTLGYDDEPPFGGSVDWNRVFLGGIDVTELVECYFGREFYDAACAQIINKEG